MLEVFSTSNCPCFKSRRIECEVDTALPYILYGTVFILARFPIMLQWEETDSSGFKTRTIVSTGAIDRSSILLRYH